MEEKCTAVRDLWGSNKFLVALLRVRLEHSSYSRKSIKHYQEFHKSDEFQVRYSVQSDGMSAEIGELDVELPLKLKNSLCRFIIWKAANISSEYVIN